MMIRSVGYALSWEYWRRGMFWFVPAALAPTLVCLLLVIVPRVPSSFRWADVGTFVRPAMIPFVLMTPLILALASWTALRRHYTLPLPTLRLVCWSLVNGALAAAGTYCGTALALNVVLHANWPLTIPAMCSATAYVVFQAALWWLGPSRGLLGTLAAAGCGSLAAAGRLSAGRSPLVERVQLPQEWSQLSAIGVAVWLGVIAVSCLLAVNGVARDRRGEAWSLAWPSRWWTGLAEAVSPRSRDQYGVAVFRSAASAQFWFVWRAKGRFVPLSLALMLAGLGLCFGLLAMTSYEVLAVLEVFTFLFLVASPLIGIFLGSGPQGFGSTTFTATRPLTDGTLAAATLRCAVVSVGSAAVIWLAGSLAALAIWAPEAWQRLRSLWNVGVVAVFERHGWQNSLLVLVCWTFVGLGASLAMSRRWLVAWSGAGIGGLFLSAAYVADRVPAVLAEALIVLVAAACLSCTVAAFIAARRRGLLSGRAVFACAAGYLVLLICLHGTVPTVVESALCIGFAAAPFAPFAAAPFAVSWNRHR
ncbi:MAG: hypothetical protein MUE50_08900 [Pirellulaceae bacterium]|nr:hypothetical protein [Pirellulaceae bacterium]